MVAFRGYGVRVRVMVLGLTFVLWLGFAVGLDTRSCGLGLG